MTREEAIKEAYGIPVTKAQHEALQILIPELAENDDDRIRNEIVNYFSQFKENGLRGVDITQWIAYLEKQKALSELGKYIAAERTKPGFMFAGNDSVSWEELPLDVRKHDYPYYFIGDLDCYPFNVEKQKKQEPSELEQLAKLREMTHEIREAYERGIEVGRAEPKPAWSEEDERFIKDLCNLLAAIAKNNYVGCYYAPDMINKIQSMRPQPKQEWSEEDERMLNRCVKSIESSKNFAETQTFKEAKDKEKEWLISLPERFNLQDVREQYPIEDCDYGLEIALDILVKTLNKVQGYQTDDGIREHQTAIQAVKDAMKPWSYPYGKNETVDKLIAIAECLEMDGDCMFNGISGDDCGKFLRDLARKQTE